MNNRTKLLTAAGSALLLSGIGGALALWADTASGDNLWTNTGHLNVSLQDDSVVYDISEFCAPVLADAYTAPTWSECAAVPMLMMRNANGQAFGSQQTDASDWKMVPGDTIRIIAPVYVDVYGQNIAAKLEAGLLPIDPLEDPPTDPSGFFDLSGTGIDESQFTVTPIGVFDGSTYEDEAAAFAALSTITSDKSEDLTFYFTSESEQQQVYVVIDVEFLDLMGLNIDWSTGVPVVVDQSAIEYGGYDGDPFPIDGSTLYYQDADGQTEGDLMDVAVWPLLKGIKVQLVQIRGPQA